MKKLSAIIMVLACIFGISGCNNKNMNYIISNKPSITGIVEEVNDNSVIIYCQQIEGYPSGAECSISLDVKNKDSMTHFNKGDEIVVYYNGDIAESDPMQINTVYAITLKNPADRNENNKS